ncbi:hypothetical protein ACI2WT_18275 [Lysinibacillus fusiformis]
MVNKNKDIINRDASDKYKGFRYQKFRLAKKMLELIKINLKTNIIAFPELRDDGYFIEKNGKQIFEQNKDYSEPFSFNSLEIRKSMVNFLDNYFELDKDPNLQFIFFTNVTYTSERNSNLLRKIDLKPLEKPVLKYLVEKELTAVVVDFVAKALVQTYIDEYNIDISKVETYKGYYEELIRMDGESWNTFLNSVTFQFGEGDIDELNLELEKEIKECNFYRLEHVNREQVIKMCLLETIDKRMGERHFTQKMINVETIKNIYYEVSSRENSLSYDEIFIHWESLEEERDSENLRNLKEKIYGVCQDFRQRTLNRYSREATTVRDEIKSYDKKQIYSLRYRVYESMEKFFDEVFHFKESYTFEELNGAIKILKQCVVEDINILMEDFDYGIKNKITIEKMVLLLIDECFHSFDEE